MKKLLLSLMFCGSAHAAFQSGNDLHRDMFDSDTVARMYALGYIVGVADMGIGSSVCFTAGVTQGQLLDVVKNFSSANPQVRNLPAHIIVTVALMEHWPCKGKKKS
jgi:hypothetical protein